MGRAFRRPLRDYRDMALHQNPHVRRLINFFLKVALTDSGRWFLSNVNAKLDPLVFRWTKGRFTSTGPALFPMLALTTTGRKSGQPRVVQLAYIAFEGQVHIVASNFG